LASNSFSNNSINASTGGNPICFNPSNIYTNSPAARIKLGSNTLNGFFPKNSSAPRWILNPLVKNSLNIPPIALASYFLLELYVVETV